MRRRIDGGTVLEADGTSVAEAPVTPQYGFDVPISYRYPGVDQAQAVNGIELVRAAIGVVGIPAHAGDVTS